MAQERRRNPRDKHRVSCQFACAGSAGSGFVTDLSPRGLFVQSNTLPAEASAIRLILRDPSLGEIHCDGKVARKRAIHRSAAVVRAGGFGVELARAPESYYALLESLHGKSTAKR